MNEYYISYPQSDIHILDYAYPTYINLRFSHNGESYLITRSVRKNKKNPDVRLLLKLKDKSSIIYSILILEVYMNIYIARNSRENIKKYWH